MRIGRQWFVVFGWMSALGLCLPLLAVDLDGDGMSDIWELVHGAQDLLPNADPDDDGLTNLEESIAGSTPFESGSKPTISRITQDPQGDWRAHWFGEIGKEYVLEGEVADRWISLGPAQIGTGADLSQAMPPSVGDADHGRLRLAVRDVDTNGNGLNDWEAAVIGADDLALATSILNPTNLVEIHFAESAIGEDEETELVLTRLGGARDLTIRLQTSGSLVPGVTLDPLPDLERLHPERPKLPDRRRGPSNPHRFLHPTHPLCSTTATRDRSL